MPSLFYIRLISLTAGTLVYLFLLALILGHRRPRLFERLLFFLMLSLFFLYSGGLLEINAVMQYGSPSDATRLFYSILHDLGIAFLPALLVHVHLVYSRSANGRAFPRWFGNVVVSLLYVLPFAYVLGSAYILRDLPVFSFLALASWFAAGGGDVLLPAVLLCIGVEYLTSKSSDAYMR